jgi:hypothetical protein
MNEYILDQLCELYSIETEYNDIWGKTHKVSEKTKLDILRVMGVPLIDETSLHSALSKKKTLIWKCYWTLCWW